MTDFRVCEGPDRLLRDHLHLFTTDLKRYPILDLACGDGHNGIFLAQKGFQIIFADSSKEALEQVQRRADAKNVAVTLWQIDLEARNADPFSGQTFSAIIVFRYLHRPIIPAIREALMQGGIMIYETFTEHQARFGKPKNPDHLLKTGELFSWFQDWKAMYTYEGIAGEPPKAIAQLVARKP